MTPPARKIILDCDPGHDDALAMMLAHADPRVELLAVTAVSGNQTLERVAHNARVVATVIGLTDTPIAAGAGEPLRRPAIHAGHIHGASGLDGPVPPVPTVELVEENAVDLIVRLVMSHEPGAVTLIGTGPATNLALALRAEPAIAGRVAEVVLMGGSYTRGNITPAAEFNVYADPDAGAEVLGAAWPVTMIGLDVTHQATATPAVRARITGLGSPCATFVSELLDFFGETYARSEAMPDPPVHDPCAVAYVIDPALVTCEPATIEVDTGDGPLRGRTVVRFGGAGGDGGDGPRRLVGTGLDATAFWDLMVGSLAALTGVVRP